MMVLLKAVLDYPFDVAPKKIVMAWFESSLELRTWLWGLGIDVVVVDFKTLNRSKLID